MKITKFQNSVYELLRQIPKGRITTYKLIAEKLSTGYRAVGLACAKNPFAPRVPCHRVVASDGKLGGYSGGLSKKIFLLQQEGIKIKNNKVINLEKFLHRF